LSFLKPALRGLFVPEFIATPNKSGLVSFDGGRLLLLRILKNVTNFTLWPANQFRIIVAKAGPRSPVAL
jgi:hypothetical protein